MTNSSSAAQSRIQIDRRLLMTGAVLTAVGGLVGFAGMALGGMAVLGAARHWVRQMDVAPREIATVKWRQAKEGTHAAAQAWRAAAPSRS
jgi:hypothetical protein